MIRTASSSCCCGVKIATQELCQALTGPRSSKLITEPPAYRLRTRRDLQANHGE
jgi:hypothetical protein